MKNIHNGLVCLQKEQSRQFLWLEKHDIQGRSKHPGIIRDFVGCFVGFDVGCSVGRLVGPSVGDWDGKLVGNSVGALMGCSVGRLVGPRL